LKERRSSDAIIKRNFFVRLLLNRDWWQVCSHQDGLLVKGSDKEFVLSLQEMLQPAEMLSGILGTRLIIKTNRAVHSVAGFKQTELSPLIEKLNSRLQLHAENLLRAECLDLHTVSQSIQQFLDRKQYARDSKRRQLLDLAIRANAVQQRSFWSFYAKPEQLDSAAVVSKFIQDSENLVREANAYFVENELSAYKKFFDTVERKPLTLSQRRSCVIIEDNNLVLAGAGTGKTSTMIGRAGYLLASNQAMPDELLMLAFARKAAGEMQERMDKCLRPLLAAGTPTIKTFHALGLEIIGKVEGRRPSLSILAEDSHAFTRFIDEQLDILLSDAIYKSKIVRFFTSYLYPYRNPFDFDSMQEYNDYICKHEMRTLQGEAVKSYEECEIANFLLQHGVSYKYEEPYVIDTAGPDHRQYKPDFFLPDYNIYIEHFALDKAGRPPKHIDQSSYLAGIKWKREQHNLHKTTLIETYSHLKREGRLQTVLAEELTKAGVKLVRRPDQELLAELREKGAISDFAKLIQDFVILFKQSYLAWQELWEKAKGYIDTERMHCLLEIFKPIYESYQKYLQERREIDFADMIAKAIEHVESRKFDSPYTHILVDEFQDISDSRARLLTALKRQRPECVLFAVGDDWQSIYRFTGSDIGLTKHFEKSFGSSAVTALDTTFRFNNMIGAVSSSFVLKNPEQISKTISSNSTVQDPAVSLIRALDSEQGVRLALNAIDKTVRLKRGQESSVMILARYNFQLSPEALSRTIIRNLGGLDIECMTAHAAKGKEADYVIVLGVDKGKHGFPSEKVTDPLLEFLLPQEESYKFAEERRLFYVALTRARHRVYLVYNPLQASSFIKELLNQKYPVCTTEFDESVLHLAIADVPCPRCMSGSLIPKNGEHGSFVGCNNYPFCRYTERGCPQCSYLMARNGRFRTCANENCRGVIPICPACGGEMVKRNGPYGPFWGCRNYRQNSAFICTHTEKRIDFSGIRV